MDKGIIESKSIIIDATHTKSRYNSHPIREVLQEHARRLLKTIEGMPVVPNLPRIIEKMNLLKETMEDTKEEMYKSASVKPDHDRPLFLVETRSPDIEVLAVVV